MSDTSNSGGTSQWVKPAARVLTTAIVIGGFIYLARTPGVPVEAIGRYPRVALVAVKVASLVSS